MNDSRVVDALQEARNLEHVLEELGCDTRKDTGQEFERRDGYIHCPMPNHPDNNPSCSVVADLGILECRSLCGTIRPLDLIIAHGQASTRGDAAKWVERVLKMETAAAPKPRPVVDDPSLTVEQYLAMKGLPQSIADKFRLETVKIWQAGADKGVKDCAYETGWYDAVYMPNREGRRPRVRSAAPGMALKWAPKVRHQGVGIIDYSNDDADATKFNYKPDAIGLGLLEPVVQGPLLLVVVEGESDVHALHAMGIPCVVGAPGAKFPGRIAAELVEACLIANRGDTDLSTLTVITWQEPGSAGAAFPLAVQRAIALRADQDGLTSPRFVALHHGQVDGAPKDPCSLLQDRSRDAARAQLVAALLRCCPPASAGELAPAPIPANIAPAHAPMQIDGHHTVPPVTVVPVPPLGVGTVEPVPVPPVPTGSAATGTDDVPTLWTEFDTCLEPPAKDMAPGNIDGISGEFVCTPEGWSSVKISSEGDRKVSPICSPFVVEAIERCDGEILARVAAPFGGYWNRARVPMSSTADAGRTCAALAAIGVQVVNRQRPSVTDLLLALMRRSEELLGAVDVPATTGWAGRPGTSPFGGIECEPVNALGARMFESNERRRADHPDTADAARKWHTVARELLVPGEADEYTAAGAAALLAVGAAAAAPLVGPLSEIGVKVSPVVWMAGLGGGGKTMTQRLAAAIFAPNLPDLDGQVAYFANANMSQAALSARVDSCRDLPLTLDDVTQIPPAPGSTSKGDAARIEAAAHLGMMVFNRKSIERATRDGGIRATRDFRSTAIFSAEISMSSETSRAVVTAGHRRRIATIESQPMAERAHLKDLEHEYADRLQRVEVIGGAAGELLVLSIRDSVANRTIEPNWKTIKRAVEGVPSAGLVTRTQLESISMLVLGYVMLVEVCSDITFTAALEEACQILEPYFAAGAAEGGATRDVDLTGVAAALQAVEDLRASHPMRFDNQALDDAGMTKMPTTMGWFGKELRLEHGKRRIGLLDAGMRALSAKGVTSQVIEQALADGCCKRGLIRMSDSSRAYGYIWTLPVDDFDPEEFESEEVQFDHDPHALAAPHIPGGTVRAQEPVQDPSADLEMSEQCLDIDNPSSIWAPLAKARADVDYEVDIAGCYAHQIWLRRPGLSRMLYTQPDLTQEQRMDTRFQFGQGIYLVGDGPHCRQNVSVLKMVRVEARQELEFLQLQYKHAAEKNPEYVIGVADFLPDDDPRWAAIDAIGQDAARLLYTKDMPEAMYARNQAALADQLPWDEKYVKAYRVHLMCRYRHPEWFIVGKDLA